MITVAIDPGHGGSNRGCAGNGIIEKDWTLETAKVLFESFENDTWVVPVLLRESDEYLSLSERGSLSEKMGADLVVSIHVNASDESYHRSALVFSWPGDNKGQRVAEVISESMPLQIRRDRGAWEASGLWPRVRNVMSKHRATTVLVECGFSTNKEDAAYMATKQGKVAIANAIRAGVIEFWHLTPPGSGKIVSA